MITDTDYNVKLDISLALQDLKKELGRRKFNVLERFLKGYKISEICRYYNMSRFVVTKILKECLEYVKRILEAEGVYYVKRKKNKHIQKKTRS